MAIARSYLSEITFNVNGLNFQSKDVVYLNGLRNKKQNTKQKRDSMFAACKRLILVLKTPKG